jgi:FtsP/CotA-like multicopper oxidase with cupredoxin domain
MIGRRAFVGMLAAGGTAAGINGWRRPFEVSANSPSIRTIQLETRVVSWELGPGRTIKAMAYNGRVPGPEIRVREGERVRIVLKNSLDEPTTIHWHGVEVPNSMDGVPDITQKPVQPGETFVYEFEARPAGTRWYHTHVHEHRQMDLGLAAPLIIEPTEPEPMPYDRELMLVLDDWATGSGEALPTTSNGTAGGRGGMGGMMGGMMRGGGRMGGRGMGGMMGGMMGRGNAAHEPAYDTMTINGKAFPATEPLGVRKGERVRLRVINASNEHTHVIRVAGHRLHVTHTDGNPLESPVSVDAIPVAPSERYDVILIADHPGAWLLHCTQPGHAAAGEQMLVVYEAHAGGKLAAPEPSLEGLRVWQYGLGRGRQIVPASAGATRTFDQTLSGGMRAAISGPSTARPGHGRTRWRWRVVSVAWFGSGT